MIYPPKELVNEVKVRGRGKKKYYPVHVKRAIVDWIQDNELSVREACRLFAAADPEATISNRTITYWKRDYQVLKDNSAEILLRLDCLEKALAKLQEKHA